MSESIRQPADEAVRLNDRHGQYAEIDDQIPPEVLAAATEIVRYRQLHGGRQGSLEALYCGFTEQLIAIVADELRAESRLVTGSAKDTLTDVS
jgi:hypothetical protein